MQGTFELSGFKWKWLCFTYFNRNSDLRSCLGIFHQQKKKIDFTNSQLSIWALEKIQRQVTLNYKESNWEEKNRVPENSEIGNEIQNNILGRWSNMLYQMIMKSSCKSGRLGIKFWNFTMTMLKQRWKSLLEGIFIGENHWDSSDNKGAGHLMFILFGVTHWAIAVCRNCMLWEALPSLLLWIEAIPLELWHFRT